MTIVLDTVRLKLHDIAHGRSGDKGNRSNISVIPYCAEAYPLLLEQVTEAKVLELFAHKGASAVKRYELPNLPALNFVIDDALEGGVNSTLNLDLHGKTLSFMLLAIPVEVPLERVAEFTDGRRG
ncbi:hypothetical protein NUH88_17505 [Nisaea acidiphila]|uniref:AtuA-like ferredoxin-fold domain-containing protein n=1 Tax=Nisaea acidiphila TaxID=1862145 RepID=A0A9J7AUV3_9PROT|nr:hypothetical protein [Nisaea acidiphila]UUX49189.1 hypothetical protein NUH88_17505 [Nisaea acidiphila]